MKSEQRYIGWLLGSLLMLLLTVGCASDSKENDVEPLPKEKPVLKVYVFAPEKPIVTRRDEGNVDASAEEAAINTLDVWVFENSSEATNGSLVGHVHQSNISWYGQKEVAINVSDDFANRRPNVDIYVAANAGAAGLTLGAASDASALEGALIDVDHFGLSLTSLVSSVPVSGLPMSGLLKNQTVSGNAPVFQAQTNSGGLATVKLVRAVSKVRFIFSKSVANTQDIKELGITLDGKVLPLQEKLFLDGVYPTVKSNIVGGGIGETFDAAYEAEAKVLFSGKTKDDIANSSDPAQYVFGAIENETGQDYETRINTALQEQEVEGVTKAAELSELGRFYLRESDRKLTGTIAYRIGEAQKSPPFNMKAAGDFTRNHTWIVYGYFMGNGELKLNVVDVKAWTEQEEDKKIYNW